MIDIKSLYGLILNEVNTDTLQPIDKNIYTNISNILTELKGQVYEGLESNIRDAFVSLISEMVNTLLEIRLSKYNTNRVNLTYEEMFIIDIEDEYKIRKDFVIQTIIEGRKKVLEGIVNKIKTKRIIVRLLANVDEFIGADNIKYGKYNAEDIVVLPLEDAKRLINDNIAKEVIMLD
ncbi:MAG: hypothetical protein QW416_03010 [Candidatus Nitrosocaldaceae archaeon]